MNGINVRGGRNSSCYRCVNDIRGTNELSLEHNLVAVTVLPQVGGLSLGKSALSQTSEHVIGEVGLTLQFHVHGFKVGRRSQHKGRGPGGSGT